MPVTVPSITPFNVIAWGLVKLTVGTEPFSNSTPAFNSVFPLIVTPSVEPISSPKI